MSSRAGEMSFTSLLYSTTGGDSSSAPSLPRSYDGLAGLDAAAACGKLASGQHHIPSSEPYGNANTAPYIGDPATLPSQQQLLSLVPADPGHHHFNQNQQQHYHHHHPLQKRQQQQLSQQPCLRPAAGSQASLATSQSHGPLLMTGPGTLCASLPRYTRQPPIEAVVFGWGVSEDGQLGLAESGMDVGTPKVVEALLGVRFSGRAFCRTPLVAGSRNTLALDVTGQVWSFGWNDRGTLGLGNRSVERKPQRIAALKGIRIAQVAMGGWHCLALSDKGTMFAWGGNEYGQCGSVVPGQRDIVEPLPVDLGLGPSQRVRQVSAGGMHSLALLEDGTVWQWGENWGDFSMHPVRTPRPVPGAVAVAAVACGAFHNLLLTAGGRVLSWGMNDYGQLGNGSTTYATAPWPVLDMDGIVVADIAAGGWHSCALSSAGEVWVWGRGEYGRLGLGDRSGSSKLRPQKVRGLESHVVVQVAAGGSHTVALTADARVFVWGRGAFGRLGLGGDNKDCYHPEEVTLPGGPERWKVAAIAAGGRHSICLAIPVRYPASLAADQASDEYDTYGTLVYGSGGGALRHEAARSSEEYDVDGYSEPSLYDKDLSYEQPVPDGPFPLRFRRTTAGACVTADGSIAAAAGGSVGGAAVAADGATAGPYLTSAADAVTNSGNSAAAAGSAGAAVNAVAEGSIPIPPIPDLRPTLLPHRATAQPELLSDWPSIDSAGGVPTVSFGVSIDGAGSGSGPAVPLPVTSAAQPSRPHASSSAASMRSLSNGGALPPGMLAPPPALPPLTAPRQPSSATASMWTMPLTGGGVGPGGGGGGNGPSPAPSASGPGSASDTPHVLDSPSRSPSQALSPLPPPPVPPLYGMRRSGSAVGPLSSLSQILPGPAAAAAAAVLDADSDLAPPRGLAAAVAAAVAGGAVSSGASRPSSGQGSAHGGASRGGSVTGMQRFRTVFGGGGEEEDEAMQAAEAAEAAAEAEEGSGGDGSGLGMGLDDTQDDDTDEDQGIYDSGGVQHPRSPSLLTRPRSPPMPLSPRRHPSFTASAAAAAAITAGVAGSTANLQRNTSAAVAAAPAGGGGGGAAAMTISGADGHNGYNGSGGSGASTADRDRAQPPAGSPASRSLLAASYGSPRVPSSLTQQ